jgi:excisionase family DNA binding protein
LKRISVGRAVVVSAVVSQRYYTIQEVAELLNISHRTVRRWIANGDLIATRVHGVVRIADDDLRAFLALHREA